MRRILAFLLVLLSALAFVVAYVEAGDVELSRMENAATAVGQAFVVPSDPQLADPVQTYQALLDSADGTRVNIFRTSLGFTSTDRSELIQYVLLTTGTHFFDAFGLKSGRWLTPSDTRSSGFFLSTNATSDRAQVGVIRDFGGNDLVSIRPLKAAFDSLTVAGQYVVESSDGGSANRFFEVLVGKINTLRGSSAKPLTVANLQSSPTGGGGSTSGSVRIVNVASYLVVFVTTILLVYYALSEAKRIGVMKLNGLSTPRVWYLLAGRLILWTMFAAAVTSLLAALVVPDTTAQFIRGVMISLARIYAVMLIASLATCAYILRVRIAESLKNRKDTKGVFVLNALVKSACSVLLIIVGVSLWTQYSDIASKQATLKNWVNTKDYGVFYPVSASNDLIAAQTGQPGATTAEVFDLYPVLNNMGSLYVDATSYEPGAWVGDPRTFQSITVNPNFLRAFPLRDSAGRPIDIPEATTDWVVLVPLKYKARQAELLAYFQRSRTGGQGHEAAYQAEEAAFNRTAPDRFIHQQVRIIWTADDQSVFSFNPLVFPVDGNVIKDPVIEVITSMNSLGIDRANMITGSGPNEALKVKLVAADSAKTMSVLGPTLKSLKLDNNLKHLVTVNEFILQEINQLRDGIKWITLAAIVLGAGLLVLLAENLAIVFDANARKIVVRRLFGLGFVRTYKELLRLLAVIWALQIGAALLANRAGVQIVSGPGATGAPPDSIVLSAAMIVVIIELVCAIIALAFIEKRHLVRVLNGVF